MTDTVETVRVDIEKNNAENEKKREERKAKRAVDRLENTKKWDDWMSDNKKKREERTAETVLRRALNKAK